MFAFILLKKGSGGSQTSFLTENTTLQGLEIFRKTGGLNLTERIRYLPLQHKGCHTQIGTTEQMLHPESEKEHKKIQSSALPLSRFQGDVTSSLPIEN